MRFAAKIWKNYIVIENSAEGKSNVDFVDGILQLHVHLTHGIHELLGVKH
jgi:hypothetical protein